MNILEVAKAWIASYNPSDEQKKIADVRVNICNECPSIKYLNNFNMYICNECACPINKKIFSENKSSCPLNKWTI